MVNKETFLRIKMEYISFSVRFERSLFFLCQVIGMHFMNPPPIMKLVEIVRGADTSDEIFVTIKSLAERYAPKTLPVCIIYLVFTSLAF